MQQRLPTCLTPRRRALSLIELMIAVVILGLGLIMVATMYPVAWKRTRDLAEFTTHQTVSANADTHVRALLRPAGPNLDVAHFAGDLIFDPASMANAASLIYSDTRVHAVNMENIQAASGGSQRVLIAEDPWRLEYAVDLFTDPRAAELPARLLDNSYVIPRISLGDRLVSPLPPRSEPFDSPDPAWDAQFESRRFAWAVFSRLRDYVGPDPVTNPAFHVDQAARAVAETRTFDMYYVTLRRPQALRTYARQSDVLGDSPDPTFLNAAESVGYSAMPRANDLMLPTPWRVKLQFSDALVSRSSPSELPAEVVVPAGSGPGYLVDMFPVGAHFIDEINGLAYQVEQRKVSGTGNNRTALLTLDKEIFFDDVNLVGYQPCETCDPTVLDPEELARTVWVFPPPVERDDSGALIGFTGPPPVVDIDVVTVNLTPR